MIHELFEHDKTYFENVTDILPSGEHVLEDGENEFNFEVFIPLDCLGSFHHSNGVRIGKGRLRPCGEIRIRPHFRLHSYSSSIFWTARIECVAKFHADVPWGVDKTKKVELFVQPAADLNDRKETLEKASI